VIGLIAVTAAGRAAAGRLAAAWPGETRAYQAPATAALPRAWAECEALVCFLATGATVRLIAPLLGSKQTDPAVVCVDEACRHAVALLGGHGTGGHGTGDPQTGGHGTGGHGAGANALAVRVAGMLGAEAVITTATDAAGLPGLDTLGWPVEGAVAAVSRAMLDGEPVRLEATQTWPLPAFPPNVGATGQHRILVTDQAAAGDEWTAIIRPPALAVGVGASRGVSADELLSLIDTVLAEPELGDTGPANTGPANTGLSPLSVAVMATVDAKAGEPGIAEAAARRGWPLTTYPATVLAGVDVPNPSPAALAAVGTPSVAEAAARLSGDVLIAAKRKSAMATAAVARIRPRGRLALIGLGPGARDLLAPRAVSELRRASAVVGLDQYLDQVRDLLRPGTRVLASGLGAEEQRAQTAVDAARLGHAVALVGSGDAGVYSMASPALSLAGQDIDVVTVPGITANLAAAALLGAPLGHDHAVISLSDLNTPWDVIERRVRAAAEGDFVVTFYNPRSRGRDWQLKAALEILRTRRPATTPAGIVRNATRPGQQVTLTTLAQLDPAAADMLSTVVVGCSASRITAGRLVTPRGYAWLPQ
jgi:cobalt-precorrin 5A hydrolase/precorrin-3B C17-methyltransferase